METNTTPSPAGKLPAPETSAFCQCDDASCALERLMILLDTITEMQRSACDEMPEGEARDGALYDVFCLLLLLHDNMKMHRDAIDRIQSSIVAEGKAS